MAVGVEPGGHDGSTHSSIAHTLHPGSTVELCSIPGEGALVAPVDKVRLVERPLPEDGVVWDDPTIYEADAVVVLGCEDEEDTEADASAISLLLRLRHSQRTANRFLKRLITEVRDPILARQIANSASDFLVSTDVVAMLVAQAALTHFPWSTPEAVVHMVPLPYSESALHCASVLQMPQTLVTEAPQT